MTASLKSASVRHIIFFSPYREVGGVPLLFLRVASALAEMDSDLRVTLIDYPNGYSAQNNPDRRLELWLLKPGVTLEIPDDAICVLQSLPPWRMPQEVVFGRNTRLLFWHLHPLNVAAGAHWTEPDATRFSFRRMLRMILYRAQRIQLGRFLMESHKLGGLVFMDQATLDVAQRANSVRLVDPIFVPVPSTKPAFTPTGRISPQVPLRCAWSGRLEDFKIPILMYTLNRLARYASQRCRRIIFHVIGSGQQSAEVEVLGKKIEHSYFKVVCHGRLTPSEVDLVLDQNVDVLFAMGTAALEGAKLGIPTVLLDFSYKPLAGDYVYRYIFNTRGYTLGEVITDAHYNAGNSSIETMLDQMSESWCDLSGKTIRYFEKNHSMNSVMEKFIAAVIGDRLTYQTLDQNNFTKVDPVMRACYSIRKKFFGYEHRIPVG